MPPKPRPLHRKASVSKAAAAVSSDPVKSQQDAAKSMPPPPDPLPPGILVPEVTALSTCLKNAVVKTGQLYGFYADTRRLMIQNYAPSPPQSLTAGLGRELEKYDQLCDSIESQLLRAISVLQRDLGREERRIKEAEAEAEAKANSIAGRTRSASRSPTSTRAALPPMDFTTTSMEGSPPPAADPAMSPTLSSSSSIAGRRPSAISISSLQRPNLPLKLDLSSSALRITAEEASLFTQGLASPVTLAPRSARPYGPNELPPEIMAALASASATSDPQPRPVDIDLTGADNPAPDVDMATIGNTADKPIELDLDAMEIDRAMSDLFGDTGDSGSNAGDGLFTPVVAVPDIAHTLGGGADGTNIKVEEESFLNALSGEGEDVFASLRVDGGAQAAPGSSGPPPSILATFSQQMGQGTSDAANQPGGPGAASYDLESLDLTNLGAGFFENSEHTDMNADMNIFDMEELLSMGGEEENGNGGQTTAGNANATTTEGVLDPAVKTEHYVPGIGV